MTERAVPVVSLAHGIVQPVARRRAGAPTSSAPPPERNDAPHPRNRAKWQAGQELQGYLRDLIRLLSCPCCHRPRFKTANELLQYLPDEMRRDPRTIRQHVRAILEELDHEES